MKKKIFTIVIFILILSFFVIKSSYALYRNIINPSGNVVAAKWNVTLNQENEDNSFSISAGDSNSTASYTVNIVSLSEVNIIYSIVVDDIPQGVKVKLDDGEYQTPSDNKVIFVDVSTINYTDESKTKSHTLTFKAEAHAPNITNGEININVKVQQTLNN